MKGIPSAILELQNGACLFVGKIMDVRRVRYFRLLYLILVVDDADVHGVQEVRKGFTWGSVTIAPLREDEEEDNSASLQDPSVSYGPEDRLIIPFQNENLYAYVESPGAARKVGARAFLRLYRS